MKIQEIVIRESNYPSLYYRGGAYKDGSIALNEGERLSFDTYFGSFTYTKYKDYTTITSVDFCGRIFGTAKVMLCSFDGERETVISEVDADGDFTVSASFNELPDKAILYPVLEARSSVRFIEGGYFSDAEASSVSFAIAICTYKREEYLLRNLELLERENIPHIDRIIVVDNGNTLDRDKIETEKVKLFKNPNYGGSAGFTRGIIEANRIDHTHVILMDDDIEIYPESIARMTAFASILKDECKNAHFSAAMLKASMPYIQHEKGALWNGSHIQSLNSDVDATDRKTLVKNLDDGPIQYGAWWCFALPMSDVRKYGLPLPLFIKFDDVEYGMRCCADAPIITMSGMAVSHADFDGKYNMHLEYYTVRNQLIMLAVHKMQSRFGCLLRLMKVSAKHLFLYRYDIQPILLRAFDDFLRGADFIMNENAEELNRSVMAMAPKGTDLKVLPDWNDDKKKIYKRVKPKPSKAVLGAITLGGHLIPSLFMKKDTFYAPVASVKDFDCFMYKSTVQYQLLGDSGYLYNKHSGKFFLCVLRCIKMAFKILFRYGKAARSYRKNKERLTSESFWCEYLDIENIKD